jgi:N-glycosidase YbiA
MEVTSKSQGSSTPSVSEIRFYRVGDDYGLFSNFAPYPVWLDGKRWPTSEHYFQARKFSGAEQKEAIRLTRSALVAARMGRDRKWTPLPDWDEVRDHVMREAVWVKFIQHSKLRDVLLDTGDARIVEHTTNDSYWADGGDGSGKNMLGLILMEVRERIRKVDNFNCIEEWETASECTGLDVSPDLLSERADLRELLWEKHFQSLSRKEQKLLNEGIHPSQSSRFAKEAIAYANELRDSLSSVGYVQDVTADVYHGDTLVLTAWLKKSLPWQTYRKHIPELFRGFQVFVASAPPEVERPR